MRPETVVWEDPATAQRIAAALRADGIVAIPTETLYGLSCRGMSADAVGRVARLKGIASPRGFVALASSVEMVELWVGSDRPGFEFLRAVWPAPLTAVLPVLQPVPWGEPRDGIDTAAFRVPAHARLRRLVGQVGEPVVSTSANRSGEPPLADAGAIAGAFGDGLDLVVTEDSSGPRTAPDRLPSTVADWTVWPPRIIRPGAFDLEVAIASWRERSAR